MFWGREHRWTGSKWEATKGTKKKDEPAPKKAAAKEPEKAAAPAAPAGNESATILNKYKLKFTGPGHEKLAKAVEKGIDKAADLCKINPPVCRGNLGRSRDTMPQFPSDDVRDSFLAKMKKQGVRVTEGKMKVGHLKASQDEIQAKKAIGMAGSYLDGTFGKIKNAIVVSKDGYIVDGHHRWAALLTVDPSEEMNVIRVGVPIKPLLDMVNDHEGVEKRGLEAASIGQEKKKQEAVWYERAADLLEKLPYAEDGGAELVGLLREYGSPVVAEPRRSGHYSPQGGYKVKPTDRMAPGRKRRKTSSRRQPFINPEDFTMTASRDRYRPLSDVLSELVAPMPRAGRSTKLAYTAHPASPGHGVGVSPAASPADREAGRHQNVVDGPVIRKSKPGYKPTRAGAGSMVPSRAKGS
jgi:hypothetical protein